MDRDYTALAALSKLDDHVIIDIDEAALLTGFAQNSIRQRKIRGFPPPLKISRHLKWVLGDIRRWIAALGDQHTTPPNQAPAESPRHNRR